MNRLTKTIAGLTAVILLASAAALLSERGTADAGVFCVKVVNGFWAYTQVNPEPAQAGESLRQEHERYTRACTNGDPGQPIAVSNIPGDQAKPNVSLEGFTEPSATSWGGFPIYRFYYDDAPAEGGGSADLRIPPASPVSADAAVGAKVTREWQELYLRAGSPITRVYCKYDVCAGSAESIVIEHTVVQEDVYNSYSESYEVIVQPSAGHRAVKEVDAGGRQSCYREWLDASGVWRRSGNYGSDAEACRQAAWNAQQRSQQAAFVGTGDGGLASGDNIYKRPAATATPSLGYPPGTPLSVHSTAFVSTLGQSHDQHSAAQYDHAQAFTTGSHKWGYTLNAAQIEFGIWQAEDGTTTLPDYEIELWTVSSGNPSSRVATLSKPDTLIRGTNTFRAVSPINLSPSTSYAIVYNASSWCTCGISRSYSDDEDSAGVGWSIADASRYRSLDNSSGWHNWSASLRMVIYGNERPAPPAITLISNLDQSSDVNNSDSTNDLAQVFFTGSHSAGYELTSVELSLRVSTPPPTFEVGLWTVVGSDIPGQKLATLSKPAALTNGVNRFSAAAPIRLNPSTKYAVVFDSSSDNTFFLVWATTSTVDTGLSGWWIRDQSHARPRGTGSSTAWSQRTGNISLNMAIIGYELP